MTNTLKMFKCIATRAPFDELLCRAFAVNYNVSIVYCRLSLKFESVQVQFIIKKYLKE